jgi:zinc protease
MTATAPASLPGSIDPASVRHEALPNGLTVLVRRDASAPVVAIVTYVKAGYFDETDDVVGIAHVLEHMYFKGTSARGVGEIAKETKASGGYLNAATIYDHTSYYTVLPASGFVPGLEIQADAFANSVIDADELRKELEVIIQEAKRKADNPTAVVTETLFEVLHDRHRMRRWRIGREEGLRRLTRDDMLRFYRNFYRPSNTVLAIVGDVDPDDAMRHVGRLYGRLTDAPVVRTPGPSETELPDFRYRELAGDVTQTQFALGWRAPEFAHPDSPLLDLIATVLGSGRASRLYRAVRERQLASSIHAYHYAPTELGVFVVQAEAKPELAVEAARATWDQVRAIQEEGIGAHELERARRIYEARWVRRLETMEGQANHLAEWQSSGGWQLADRYLERVLTAPAEEVHAALLRWLDPQHAGLVVYRPVTSPVVAADVDAMRKLLRGARATPLPVSPPREAVPAAATTRAPQLEREEAGVRVYRTRVGVPVLVRRKPGAQILHLGVFATGGLVNEGAGHGGLTLLMARTAVKGTMRRTATQIAEDAELLGGSVTPSLSQESVGFTLSVPVRHAAAAVELLADVVQRPSFPEDALDTERAVARSELAAMRDDMYRYPVRLALEAAFGDHPYGLSALGTEATLDAATVDSVQLWHRARILHAPLVIGAVGDIEPDEMAALISRDFQLLASREPQPIADPAWPARAAERVESREKAQTALALLFPGPARGDDDRFAAHLLAGVASGLGGRFFDELRDKRSLAYTVHAYASERLRAGTFAAYIATSPELEETARRGLLAEFAKLRDQPVSDEELERAKTYAIGTHAIRQESGGAVLGDMVDAWLFGRGLHELEEHDARVRAVTPSAMQALARKYFDEERRVEGIVRGMGKKV